MTFYRRDDPRSSLCRAFADPLRVRILNLLRHKGELCKHDISEFFDVPRGQLSRQMNFLERAHLVQSRVEAHSRHYKLSESISPFHLKLLDSFEGCEELPELSDDVQRQANWSPSHR